MRKLMRIFALSNLCLMAMMFLSHPHLLAQREDEITRDDIDARDEYNLYERNWDNRDFNRYDYPDTRRGSGGGTYQNNNPNNY